MTWTLLLFLGVLVCFAVYFMMHSFNEVVYVQSDIDNKKYRIQRGKYKSEQYLTDSANTLSVLNSRITKLIEHLLVNYKDDPNKGYYIKILADNYDSTDLSEAAIDQRYTTYTVDKEKIHVCLRTRDTAEKLYDIDLLMYVILHELAHMCNYTVDGTPIIGHGREFIDKFRFLVLEAIKIGVYQYTNYKSKPQEYCGMLLSSTIVS